MSIIYSSYHHYLDFSSGAAQSTRETLLALARSGRSVFALCGSFFDAPGFKEHEFYEQATAPGFECRSIVVR